MSDLSIKLSVSVSDGSFESALSVPVGACGKFNDLVKAWFGMMQQALVVIKSTQESERSTK